MIVAIIVNTVGHTLTLLLMCVFGMYLCVYVCILGMHCLQWHEAYWMLDSDFVWKICRFLPKEDILRADCGQVRLCPEYAGCSS